MLGDMAATVTKTNERDIALHVGHFVVEKCKAAGLISPEAMSRPKALKKTKACASLQWLTRYLLFYDMPSLPSSDVLDWKIKYLRNKIDEKC